MAFLPVNMQDMKERGWPEADFVLVTGDAYVDHPSFGTAIISRVLEERGFRVAVLPQPDWRGTKDFMRFGRPTIGFRIIPAPNAAAAKTLIPPAAGRGSGPTGR